MKRVHLCTGILQRGARVLLVAEQYPNQPKVLWNPPGGRQHDGELLHETLRREFAEETGLQIACGALQYVSESYDRSTGTHFTNFTFAVSADGEPVLPSDDAHVIALEWVDVRDVSSRIAVAVVREPLLAHLRGETQRYFAYADAGISIEFAD